MTPERPADVGQSGMDEHVKSGDLHKLLAQLEREHGPVSADDERWARETLDVVLRGRVGDAG